MDNKNVHDGHRKRMTDKILSNPTILTDHEILEIALYAVVPRRNTNDIAHNLLQACGSLKGVFLAEDELLLSVAGVGEKVVAHIKTIGQLLDRLKRQEDSKVRFDFADMKPRLISKYKGVKNETFYLYLLDRNRMIKGIITYDGNRSDTFDIDLIDFSKKISGIKPTYVALVHNHPSSDCNPSKQDDETTLKVAKILRLYKISLIDHIIVSGEKVFSYFYSRKLEGIIEDVNKEF